MAQFLDRGGRYRIYRELGRGAWNQDYLGYDTTLDRQVAIKVLDNIPNAEERRFRASLLHEARSAGALIHPNIATVFDFGQYQGRDYIVMEFVEGETLQRYSEAGGLRLPPETIFKVVDGASAALDYAHGCDIIHRDVKPSNIMMRNDGTIKIVDFGIATAHARSPFSDDGLIVGTPLYMAPEVIEGEAATAASDQYSLATTVYFLFTGVLPFAGDYHNMLAAKVTQKPSSPWRK